MHHDAHTAFIKLAVQRGFLTPDQAEQGLRLWSSAQRAGLKIDIAKVFLDKGILSEQQVKRLQQEMRWGSDRRILGHYELFVRIGSGGMADVYKARDRSTGRVVALKVLDPRQRTNKAAVARFIRGGKLAQRIQHANVVNVLEVGRVDKTYFIAMEYVNGPTLEQRLKEGRPLGEREALDLIKQAAEGLAAIHEHGIVHRDVKPSNLLITPSGLVKVADLGIARTAEALDGDVTLTGYALGTPRYMSPEQCASAKDVDARSDVYSLGVTLFHAVTGQPPFTGESIFEVMRQQAASQIPDPRQFNRSISHLTHGLIWRMMAKSPRERPQSMQEVIEATRRVEQSLGEVDTLSEEGLQSLYREILAEEKPSTVRRSVLQRIKSLEQRLERIRALAADWDMLSGLFEGGAPTLAKEEQCSYQEAAGRILESYQKSFPLLNHEGRGRRVIAFCQGGSVASGPPPHEREALRIEAKAGAKLLREFQAFALKARRDLISANRITYMVTRFTALPTPLVAGAGAGMMALFVMAFLGFRLFVNGPSTRSTERSLELRPHSQDVGRETPTQEVAATQEEIANVTAAPEVAASIEVVPLSATAPPDTDSVDGIERAALPAGAETHSEPVRDPRRDFGGTAALGDFSPASNSPRLIILDTTRNRNGFHYRRFIVPQHFVVRAVGPYPLRIFATEEIRIDGSLEVPAAHAPAAKGYDAGAEPAGLCGGGKGGGSTGGGPGGGKSPEVRSFADVRRTSGGGGGGSYGTAGKPGGTAHLPGGVAGTTYGATVYPSQLLGGSGGGSGGESRLANSIWGNGGAGGGVVVLSSAGEIVVNGAIRANGGNGGAADGLASGGGGGSGGLIVLRSLGPLLIDRAASVQAAGGRGGPGKGGGAKGGDGGTGRIILECPRDRLQRSGALVGAVRTIPVALSVDARVTLVTQPSDGMKPAVQDVAQAPRPQPVPLPKELPMDGSVFVPIGPGFSPSAVNMRRQVAGSLGDSARQRRAAFWSQEQGVTDLGTLPSPFNAWSTTTDINDKGQVVGHCSDESNGWQPFIWSATDGMQPLPTLGGKQAVVSRVNDAGWAVGWALVKERQTTGRRCAFLTSLRAEARVLRGPQGISDQASAINKDGLIAGSASGPQLWSLAGEPIPIPCSGGFPYDINDAGMVVGAIGSYERAGTVSVLTVSRPFIWTANEGVRLLPMPDVTYCSAKKINNSGTILLHAENRRPAIRESQTVALSQTSLPERRRSIDITDTCFYLLAGDALNKLPEYPGGTSTRYVDINDRGDLVGTTRVQDTSGTGATSTTIGFLLTRQSVRPSEEIK